MRHGSLFSGIGGFDLAAEWMGWENIFHCEWNPFGQRVLKYYWPNAISYNDITKTDFTKHRGSIDILTGGFPCQPYSLAGKRKGKEDERHLWPEMLRAIREIQPRYVVGENVRGLTNWNGGMVFDEVQADLEAIGYEVLPFLLPACAVNAPHRRDRIWFVAFKNSDQNGWRSNERKEESDFREQRNFSSGNNERVQTDNDKIRNVANSNKCAKRSSGKSGKIESNWSGNNDEPESRRKQAEQHFRYGNVCESNTNTDNQGLQRGENIGSVGKSKENRSKFFAGLIPSNWQKFPTKSPICFGNDGLSSRLDGITFPKWRNESIKGAGNAIVPQVAHQIFKAIDRL